MAYLSFISDRDLIECIDKLFKVYENQKQSFTLGDFYKNQVDPIKLLFDMKFFGLSEDELIAKEIQRKIDKTISNAIGEFHENLLGCIEGFKKHPVGTGFDISDENMKRLFADIKNKHNTVKGANLPDLYRALEGYIEGKEEAKGLWVQIISSGDSFCEKWTIPSKNKYNPNIFKVSGDQFYYILTGRINAFAELLEVLPNVIDDYLSQNKLNLNSSNVNVYKELVNKANKNNVSVLIQITNDTFSKYNGFPIK